MEGRVVDGVTTTLHAPTNEELREKALASEENGVTPQMVYRRMNFPDGVPPEYAWTKSARSDEVREDSRRGVLSALRGGRAGRVRDSADDV